jgi:DNA processing protein
MISGVGRVTVRNLLEQFPDAAAILRANPSQLQKVSGVGPETAAAIAGWEKSVDLAGELRRIAEYGCQVVIQSDENYPELLKQLYDPPLVNHVPI